MKNLYTKTIDLLLKKFVEEQNTKASYLEDKIQEFIDQNKIYEQQILDIEALNSLENHSIVYTNYKNNRRFFLTFSCDYNHENKIKDIKFKILIKFMHNDLFREIGSLFGKFIYTDVDDKHKISIEFFIIDILVDDEFVGDGYGSLIMEHFLKFAKKMKIVRVYGEFSKVDDTEDNRERRSNLYKKFGFYVNGDKVEKFLYTEQGVRLIEITD